MFTTSAVPQLDLFAAPNAEPPVSQLDLFAAPATAAPQQTSNVDGLQSRLGDLFNAPPAATATGGYSQANPFDLAPAQPVAMQQQGPMVGMQQINPPKKEEPKDPFAGLAGF